LLTREGSIISFAELNVKDVEFLSESKDQFYSVEAVIRLAVGSA